MAESNFVDYVKIYCRSGKGGRGTAGGSGPAVDFINVKHRT